VKRVAGINVKIRPMEPEDISGIKRFFKEEKVINKLFTAMGTSEHN